MDNEYVRCCAELPCSVASDLRARVRELEGAAFMLPAPEPATPIPPDPRDVVVEAAATVLEGFDQGVFVRSTTGDHEFGWALKLLPYIVALGKLEEAVRGLRIGGEEVQG